MKSGTHAPTLGKRQKVRRFSPIGSSRRRTPKRKRRKWLALGRLTSRLTGLVASALIADLLDDYTAMRERNGASPNSVRSYRLFAKYARKYLATSNARDLRVVDFNRYEQRLMVPKELGGQGLSRPIALSTSTTSCAAHISSS